MLINALKNTRMIETSAKTTTQRPCSLEKETNYKND